MPLPVLAAAGVLWFTVTSLRFSKPASFPSVTVSSMSNRPPSLIRMLAFSPHLNNQGLCHHLRLLRLSAKPPQLLFVLPHEVPFTGSGGEDTDTVEGALFSPAAGPVPCRVLSVALTSALPDRCLEQPLPRSKLTARMSPDTAV